MPSFASDDVQLHIYIYCSTIAYIYIVVNNIELEDLRKNQDQEYIVLCINHHHHHHHHDLVNDNQI